MVAIQVFVSLGLQGIDIDLVDVIGIADLVGGWIEQRQVEVFGVDQLRQLLMHRHQKRRSVAGAAGQIDDVVKHPLGDLRSRQGVGLQPVAQAQRKVGQCRVVALADRRQQPAKHIFTAPGRPAVQAARAAKGVELAIVDTGRPIEPGITCAHPVQLLACAVDHPRLRVRTAPGRPQHGRKLVGREQIAQSCRLPVMRGSGLEGLSGRNHEHSMA